MDLPDDILFLICQTLFTNRNISHRDKVRQISRVGRVNRQMRQFEHMFWRALIKGIAARPIKMPKYLKVIYSILKTSLIISKNDPKHIYIYTHFSCHSCGEKSKLSCKKCKDNICEDCAPYFRHDCFGAVDPTDLQCTSCVKRCPACTAPYCNECSEYCVQCPDRFCFRCIEHDAPGGHTFGDGLRNDYCKVRKFPYISRGIIPLFMTLFGRCHQAEGRLKNAKVNVTSKIYRKRFLCLCSNTSIHRVTVRIWNICEMLSISEWSPDVSGWRRQNFGQNSSKKV